MGNEQRAEARKQVSLPIHIGGAADAHTRDISASGLFFETDSEQRVGGLIDLEIDFDTPGGPLKLKAQGRIVRIEPHLERIGVGVKLLRSRLKAVE